jgi:hypothetical protein
MRTMDAVCKVDATMHDVCVVVEQAAAAASEADCSAAASHEAHAAAAAHQQRSVALEAMVQAERRSHEALATQYESLFLASNAAAGAAMEAGAGGDPRHSANAGERALLYQVKRAAESCGARYSRNVGPSSAPEADGARWVWGGWGGAEHLKQRSRLACRSRQIVAAGARREARVAPRRVHPAEPARWQGVGALHQVALAYAVGTSG